MRYITELEVPDRRVFLNFLTGSNRLPAGGFAALEPKMTLVRRQQQFDLQIDREYPTVNTCKHYVRMPQYDAYDTMKERLDEASRDGSNNFDFDWVMCVLSDDHKDKIL